MQNWTSHPDYDELFVSTSKSKISMISDLLITFKVAIAINDLIVYILKILICFGGMDSMNHYASRVLVFKISRNQKFMEWLIIN